MKFKFLFLTLALILFSACSVGTTGIAIVPDDTVLKDFNLEMSFNRISGYNAVAFSSRNPDVDNTGSREDIWEGGGLMTYLVDPERYNITSTSPLDSSTGTGLRNLEVRCLNINGTIISQPIPMNGTGIVQTDLPCLRPISMVGTSGGNLQENQGTITATSAVTGNLQLQMNIFEGVSKNSHFTVPSNNTAIIKQIQFGATKGAGQSPIIEVRGKIRRPFEAIWRQTFDFKLDTSVSDIIVIAQPLSNEIPEGSDFRLEVNSDTDNVDVQARMWVVFSEINVTNP